MKVAPSVISQTSRLSRLKSSAREIIKFDYVDYAIKYGHTKANRVDELRLWGGAALLFGAITTALLLTANPNKNTSTTEHRQDSAVQCSSTGQKLNVTTAEK